MSQEQVAPGEVKAAVEADLKAELASIEARLKALEERVLALVEKPIGEVKKLEERVVAAFKHLGHDIKSICSFL